MSRHKYFGECFGGWNILGSGPHLLPSLNAKATSTHTATPHHNRSGGSFLPAPLPFYPP